MKYIVKITDGATYFCTDTHKSGYEDMCYGPFTSQKEAAEWLKQREWTHKKTSEILMFVMRNSNVPI